MLIDIHVHESKYSGDSFLGLNSAVRRAKELGLDGICITNHDNNLLRNEIGDYAYINDLLVIVGAEVYTREGDILVFGLDDIPEPRIPAKELLKKVKDVGGVAISAHPFRHNNRGLKDYIGKVSDSLTGIEAFNGSTFPHHNLTAYALATELELPSFGASDAHTLEQLGIYATNFFGNIRDYKDFIEAAKSGDSCPVIWKNGQYEQINIYSGISRLEMACCN
jgi:predicted metal-dependent phosphoesterase TrpH